jgi:tetratricopeptide (TPR) repeat protein
MSVDDYLLLAGNMLEQSRPADAFEALLRAERLDPGDAAVHLGLGGIHLHARRYKQAVASLERAVALDPDMALAHYNLGMALQRLNSNEAAIAAFARAVALDPSLADAYSRMGDILDQHARRREAGEFFRRAAEAAPETTAGRLNRAKWLIAEHRLVEAEDCLRQIVTAEPDNWLAHWVLGSMLSEAGRFDAALECFKRTIALQPQYVSAYFSIVSAKSMTDGDRELVGQMQQCLRYPDLTDAERMLLHFGLGKAFDDLHDYAAAMRHFDAANELRRGDQSINRSAVSAHTDRLIQQCSAQFLAGIQQHSDDETPVLIVGMPRSGTTLIEQIISSHPRVEAGGELGFWVRAGQQWDRTGLGVPDSETVAALATNYRALLSSLAPNAARVTDKQPYNFEWLGLIASIFPRARIVHCRRNPLDTCLSIYCTPFVNHQRFESDKADLAFFYCEYLRLMAHWRSVLPPTQFLEIDYETVVNDRNAITRELIAFCGLEWDEACLRYEANPNTVRTASKWQVRQPIYRSSVGRWRRFAPWLGELRGLDESAPVQ